MKIELFWGVITLIGIILSIKYRMPFKNSLGPLIIGFISALWIAYISG